MIQITRKIMSVAALLALPLVGLASTAAHASGGTVWDRLSQCESTGNFSNQDTGGNGHYGGFQFSPQTWASVGGSGDPANASPGEQLSRAKTLLAEAGPGQWACASQVGLTSANGAAEGLSGTDTPAATPQAVQHVQQQSTPQTSQPVAPASTGSTHTVQACDTFWALSGGNVTAIEAANPGVNPNDLQIGSQLNLP